MLKADTSRNRLLGIGLVSVTVICFAVLDTSAKWLVRHLPVLEVVWLRFVVHVLFTAAILAPRRGLDLVRVVHPRLQVLRGGLLFGMTALNFWALQYLQLAETAAIQFAVPFLIALFGAWVLRERLDGRRWTAIAVGFGGVLLIVRPGSHAFHPAILLSIGNVLLYAVFNLLTRRLAADDRPESTQFVSALTAACLMAPGGLAVWRTPDSTLEWGLIGLMGVAGGLGHWLLAAAHRFAPASVLGPFLYEQIVWMTLLGWIVFGDVPELPVIVGAAVVVASGLYLVVLERRGERAGALG